MSKIVAVHGILNTYSGEHSMAATWAPALLDGLTRAGGAHLLAPDDIACAFYGDIYRPTGRTLGNANTAGLSPSDVDAEEAQLLNDWWAEASRTDPGVPPPDGRTLGILKGVQAALAALACSRYLAGTAERLLILWLKQVRRYFTDADCRAEIQQRFTRSIREDTAIVVAHSLGSVVAYEALCAHPEWNVTTLVTLGSPLGIRSIVLDRLQPAPVRENGRLRGQWPAPIRHWTNIADKNDFVALVKTLGSNFGSTVKDVEVANGIQVHGVERYLTSDATGRAVLAGLRL